MILLEYLQSYRDVNIEGNTHALTFIQNVASKKFHHSASNYSTRKTPALEL